MKNAVFSQRRPLWNAPSGQIIQLVERRTGESLRNMSFARKQLDDARECLIRHDLTQIDPQHK